MNGIRITGPGYGNPGLSRASKTANNIKNKGFSEHLNRLIQSERIKMSKHATSRLESRNMELTDRDRELLDEAIGEMEAKGTKNGLVIIEDKAMVLNVPCRTVITVMDIGGARGNVFTNIDGAVIK